MDNLSNKQSRLEELARAAFAREILRKVKDVIVPLNDQGYGPPIYSVHSITGAATNFTKMAQMLDSKPLFFGIQTPSYKRNGQFPASIESISHYYVEELMKFQPTGDLVLGGHSVGAVIALEMAQQLHAIGRVVRLLVVFDGELFNTGADTSPLSPLYAFRLLYNFPRWAIAALSYFTFGQFLKRIERKLASVWKVLRAKLSRATITSGHAVSGFINTDYCTPEHVAYMQKLFEVQYDYVPKAYEGPVVVYVARDQPLLHLRQIAPEWRAIAPHADIVRINANHTSIMQEGEGKAVAIDLSSRLAHLRCAASVL
jgi:thioesterase domain-containing protein